MVRHLGLEPLTYAVGTLTWTRAGLLLLVAVFAGIPKGGSPWALQLLDRVVPASLMLLFMLLLLYVTATIVLVQIGTPRYTFWQVFPSAAALGCTVAIAFLAWMSVQERQVDLILTFVAFVIFAPLLALFFSLVLGVMPRLIGWR